MWFGRHLFVMVFYVRAKGLDVFCELALTLSLGFKRYSLVSPSSKLLLSPMSVSILPRKLDFSCSCAS